MKFRTQAGWRTGAVAAATAALVCGGLTGPPAAAAAPADDVGILACGDRTFNAEAVLNGSTWTSRNGSSVVYTSGDMRAAVQAAINSLTSGRTSKQWVVVCGSGSVSAGSESSSALRYGPGLASTYRPTSSAMSSRRSMSRTPEKSYTPGAGEWNAQLKYSDTALNPVALNFLS